MGFYNIFCIFIKLNRWVDVKDIQQSSAVDYKIYKNHLGNDKQRNQMTGSKERII